jgi:WD40 repeat protein
VIAVNSELQVWDCIDLRLETRLANHDAFVHTVTCFPDDTVVISGDNNGRICVWDIEQRALKYVYECGHPIRGLAAFKWGGSRRILAAIQGSLTENAQLVLLDTDNEGVTARLRTHAVIITTLAVSNDGSVAVYGDSKGMWAVDMRTLEIIGLRNIRSYQLTCGWIPDTQFFVTGGHSAYARHAFEPTLRVWRAPVMEEVWSARADRELVAKVVVSRGGDRVYVAGIAPVLSVWKVVYSETRPGKTATDVGATHGEAVIEGTVLAR